MKKVYAFITRSLALLAIITITSFSHSFGQLDVIITYNGSEVDPFDGCFGSNTILNSEVFNGSGDYIYTWTCDPVVGTFFPLDEDAVFGSATPAGTYTVTLDVEDNISGFTGSDVVTVIINPRPLANIVANGPTAFCLGSSVELEETNNQVGVSYQWLRNGVNIPSETNDTYVAIQTGSYRVRVSYESTGCFLNSNAIGVTVHPLPAATASNDGPYCYGQTINLTSGPDLMVSYSWTTDATTPFVSSDQNPTIPSATPNNSGTYTVLVEDVNTCQSTAQTVVLVYEELDPGGIGYDHSICYGGDPDEIVSVTDPSGGDGNWTYQWQSRPGHGPWSNIDGATDPAYDPPAGLTTLTHFRRRATSPYCGQTVNTDFVIVTVYAEEVAGTISNPKLNLCYGEDLQAFVSETTPSGGHPDGWTYQWERREDGGDWEDIAGATLAAYNPGSPFPLYITTDFRRREINSCKTLYSNIVTINVYDEMFGGTIQAQADQPICYGDTPSTITEVDGPTGGNGAWSYKWYSSTNGIDWTQIAGEFGNEYTPADPIYVTTYYRRMSTNLCGDTYSNTVMVEVWDELDPGTIAYDNSTPICYNTIPGNISSTSAASGGDDNFTYQWQWSTNLIDWFDIAGAHDLDYTPLDPITVQTYYRRVATSLQCGPVATTHVTVSVHADIAGGTINGDQTICYGDAPYLSFNNVVLPSGGSNSFSYKWQFSENGVDWTDILVNNSSYTHLGNLFVTTYFRRVATDAQCPTPVGISNTVTVTVHPEFFPGSITIADTEVCHGESPGTINEDEPATGGAGATSYKWYKNEGSGWVEIIGEVGISYAVPALTQTTIFRRWAENSCGNGYSNEITITVHPLPLQYNVTGGGEYCEGSVGVLVGLDGSQSNVTYTLLLDGNPTGTTASGTGAAISFGLQTAEGTYTVHAENNTTHCENMMLGSVDVTEVPVIGNNVISADQTICSGTAPLGLSGLEPTGGNGPGTYTYQWYSSDDEINFNPIALATNQNYAPPILAETTWYYREVKSGPCTHESNIVEIEVNQPIDNNTIADNQNICYDTAPDELTGLEPTNGNGLYTYQWQSSTAGAGGPFAPIVGAEDQNYQPGNLTQNTWFRRVVSSPPCSDHISNVIMITVSPEFTITGFDTVSPSCSDSDDGEAEVNHSGGTIPYNYSWSPTGQTSKRAVDLEAGVEYTVTVTDNFGCPASGVNTVTLTAPDPIEIDYYTVTSIVDLGGCFGDADGSIEVRATGGTPNYTYTLYRGAALVGSQTPVHPAPAIFSGLIASDNYIIEVTDANACTPAIESNIILAQPDELVVDNVAITDALCYGEENGTITITASGGTPPYFYSIDGDGGPFVPDNEFMVGEGSYEIWVMDSNGCLAEYAGNSIYIGEPDEISVGFNEVLPVTGCFGNTNGVIDIKPYPLPYDLYQYTLTEVPAESDWVDNNRFEGLAAGLYYPKVRHKETGCIAEYVGISLEIGQPQEIDFIIDNIIHVTGCWYNTNGRFRARTPSGGYGVKQVSIDGVNWYSFPRTFMNLGIGIYTVYAKDENGCIRTKQVEITGPPPIVISNIDLINNPLLCFGDSDGEIHVTASGGTGILTYYLNGGSPNGTGSWTGLPAGDYLIEIFDGNSCLLDSTVTITSPDELLLETEVVDILCSDSGDEGIIRARGTGGTAPYIITLYKGGIQEAQFTGVDENVWREFTGLAAGTDYEVEIDDANTCGPVASGLLEVIVPDPLTINLPVITDLVCNGVLDGKIYISANGGTPPYTFTLYDENDIALDALSDNVGVEFTGVAAGVNYYITVDDAHFCGPVATAPFDVTEPPAIIIDPLSISITHISCSGYDDGIISLTASGGTGDLYYTLLQGGAPILGPQDNGTFSPLAPGTYVVSITDEKGCGPILSDELVVNEPNAIELSLNVVDLSCFGDNGYIAASATEGTAPYTIALLRDAIEVASFAGVAADVEVEFDNLDVGDPAYVYVVVVTDDRGCTTNSYDITFTEPNEITIDSQTFTPISCNGEDNGTITIVATGGTGVLTYTLNEDVIGFVESNIDGTFINLSPGVYTVTITDGNLCPGPTAGPFDLTEPDAIVIDPLSISVTHISCFGSNDGTISLTASGGTGDLYYTLLQGGAPILGPQDNGTFSPLAPGTYVVSITDEKGCGPILSDELVVNEPNAIELSLNVVDLSCFGDNGYIAASATEGTAPYTIALLRDAIEVASFAGVAADVEVEFDNLDVGDPAYVYVVVVTDDRGCTINSYDISFTEPNEIVIDSEVFTPISCNGEDDGTITIVASGGTGVLTYTLYEDVIGFIDSNIDGIFSNLPPGVYTVTITDGNLCPGPTAGPFDLTEPDAIEFDVEVSGLTCFGDEITVTVTNVAGGTGGYEYSFDGGPFTGNNVYTFIPTEGGVSVDITIIVRDNSSCETTHIETIDIPNELILNLTILQQPLCVGDNSGIIFASASGGILPYLYQLNGAGPWITTGTFEGLIAGPYTVTVLDGSGCTASNTVILEDPDPIVISDIYFESPSCDPDGNSSPGLIVIEAIGGTGSFNYMLFRNGIYLTENSTGLFTGLSSGEYYIEVYDTNNCGPTTSGIITLDNPTDIEFVSFNLTHVGCYGDNTGEVEVTVTNALGTPLFSLIPGYEEWQTSNLFTSLTAGIYTVRAKDDNNCIITQEVTINQPDLLELLITNIPPSTAADTDGSITVNVSGGTPNFWYELFIWDSDLGDWVLIGNEDDTALTEHTFTNLGVGQYRIIVTDANGCSAMEEVILSKFNISLTGTNLLCFESCDGTITVNTFGGAIASITWTLDGVDYTDEMLNVHYDAINDIYINLCAGFYVAFATDIDDNEATAFIEITQPELLTISASSFINAPNCHNGTDGIIFVEPQGGTPPYAISLTLYGIDVPESGPGLYEGLGEGIYSLLIEDSNGCQYTDEFILDNPEAISYNLNYSYSTVNEIEVITLPVSSTFSYDLYIENGGDVQFVENSSTGVFTNLDELGANWYYYVHITDQNACDIETMRFRKFVPHSVPCYGDTTGYISLMFYGGNIPYDIDIYWLEGDEHIEEGWGIHEDFANLKAGTYEVTVIESDGNSIMQTVIITQPDQISVDVISVTNPQCYGDDSGYVVFDLGGGTPFMDGDDPYYWISWAENPSGVAVVDTLFNVGAGTHIFTITDANGCIYIMEEGVTIVDPVGMNLTSLFVYDLLCHNDGKGEISMWVEGGTEPINYTIYGPDGLVLTNNNGIFTNLSAGFYDLFITDALGCNFTFPEGNRVVINEPDPIIISTLQPIEALECHYFTVPEVVLQVQGGTPNYTYLWDNGQQTLNLINATPNEYTITVTDANGCVESLLVDIPGPREPEYLTNITIANCRVAPGGDVGAIQIYDVIGGNGIFSSSYDVRWYYQNYAEPLPNLNGHWTINDLKSGNYIARISYPTYSNPSVSCWDTTLFHVPFDEANNFTLRIEKEKDIFCWGESAHLSADVIEGNIGNNPIYRWYNVTDDPNTIVSTTDTYITYPLDEDKVIDLVVLSTIGCRENRRDTLNTYPQIGPYLPRSLHSFFSDADLVTFGDTTVISVLADTDYPVEVFTISSGIGLTYSWDPAIFFEPSNSSTPTMIFATGVYESILQNGPTIPNPITNKDEKYIPITGMVQSEYGCREDIELKARILNKIATSNVFTPNDDGVNDRWVLPYADLFENLEIKVFNRWGAIVWSAKGSEAARGWDGKNKNGKDLPVGTYYYVINFNVEGTSKWKPVSGSITIVR